MKTAAIYARVSTADQIKGTSLDGQVQSCQEYAKEHGYTVVKIMQEDASGARLNRPKLGELRDMAARREIEALIVFDPDRLSRSMAHTMLLVEEFERNKAGISFVNAPREDTPEGKMLFGMKSLFAEYERAKIMERTRRGKERRAKEGKVLGNWATPFGYTYVVGEGRFEIAPVEAQIVTCVFDWYVNEGASLRVIARRLDEMQIPTKRGATHWHPSTVRAMLINETYGGTWYYNKNESVVAPHRRYADGREPQREKSGHLERPKEDWIGVQVPAIISSDLYVGVREQMDRNARLQKRNCKTEYLLRGLLTCKQCGRRLTARSATTYSQYYCTGKYDTALKDSCKCPWPNTTRLDARVWERIAAIMSDEEQIADTLKKHEANRATNRAKIDAELAIVCTSELTLKAEETRWMDAYAKSAIDVDQLQERMAAVRKQKDVLTQLKADLHVRLSLDESAQAQQDVIRHQVALAKKGLPQLQFEERRAFLEGISFHGVVDGETDTLYVTGYIRSFEMSVSGKEESGFHLSTYHQRAVQRIAKSNSST